MKNSMLLTKFTFLFLLFFTITATIGNCSNDDDREEPTTYYEHLRSFAGELGNMVKDVANGIEKLGKGIRHFEEFLDATVDEDCVFECPNGEPGLINPSHRPTSNGCGSFGLEDYLTSDMLPSSKFISCCNDHDICYETCGSDKDDCDIKFKKCLYSKCRDEKDKVGKLKHKGCQAGAKILYTGTTALGCKPYINAQREACVCSNSRKPPKDEF